MNNTDVERVLLKLMEDTREDREDLKLNMLDLKMVMDNVIGKNQNTDKIKLYIADIMGLCNEIKNQWGYLSKYIESQENKNE